MMAVDTVLYLCAFLYLEYALPSRFGAREHPCFCVLPRWWATGSSVAPLATVVSPPSASASAAVDAAGSVSDSVVFEPMSADVSGRPTIEIVRLVKRYGGGGGSSKLAVDGLSLSIASTHITCVLGHNGAGKTTTLSVLCGLFPPTAGDCFVFGHSVTRARRAVYRLLGVCPQHDVLWSELTVLEHLRLYGALKRMAAAQAASAAAAMAVEVGLDGKAQARSRALSGGMKRKLSVGCALIGGSKAVLLDEPSSGMDPVSRRRMWELLQRHKAGRALVLTTHYMDEAEMLADRIAVMSSGRLRCCGSSLFLRARFGLGYTLTMVQTGPHCAAADIGEQMRALVPSIEPLSQAGDELSFRVPLDASASLGALLRLLDAASSTLGIGGYGLSMSTMEEVFLQLARQDEERSAAAQLPAQPAPSASCCERAVGSLCGGHSAAALGCRQLLMRTRWWRAMVEDETGGAVSLHGSHSEPQQPKLSAEPTATSVGVGTGMELQAATSCVARMEANVDEEIVEVALDDTAPRGTAAGRAQWQRRHQRSWPARKVAACGANLTPMMVTCQQRPLAYPPRAPQHRQRRGRLFCAAAGSSARLRRRRSAGG